MKTISLLSAILALPTASLLAQGQSEIEILRTRMDAQDRRISQLENTVIRLGGSPIQKAPAPAVAKAVPVVEKSASAAASKMAKTSSSSSSSTTTEYVVVKGDTLTRIASLHKSSVAAIKKENALKSDGLRIGQKLRIPSASAAKKQVSSKSAPQKAVASKPAPTPTPKLTPNPKPVAKPVIAASDSAKYKVVAGDTFYGIARRYSMSESTLQAANPKAVPTRLQIGQILLVSKDIKPAPVKKSSQVAKKAPVKKASTKSPTSSQSSSQVTTKSSSKTAIRTITVHEQMTYGDFANKHGASTSQLNSLNGLNLSKSTMLAKGSELYVPKQY